MRRRILVVLSAIAVAGSAFVLGSAQPASATSVCAGQGTANLTQGLVYPLSDSTVSTGGLAPLTTDITIRGLRTAGFNFNFGVAGACLPGGSLTATGVLHGWCGHSAGSGVTADGFAFGYTSAGSVLVVSGGLTGVANAVPNALASQSCSPLGPGASQFLVTGAAAKVHCAVNVLSSGLPTIVPAHQSLTDILPTPGLTVHTVHLRNDNIDLHYTIHVCVLGVL